MFDVTGSDGADVPYRGDPMSGVFLFVLLFQRMTPMLGNPAKPESGPISASAMAT